MNLNIDWKFKYSQINFYMEIVLINIVNDINTLSMEMINCNNSKNYTKINLNLQINKYIIKQNINYITYLVSIFNII